MNDEKRKIDLPERTYKFAVEIVKIVQELPRSRVSYILGDQLLRAGTSIGANVEEAFAGLTKKDFIHSVNISRKEARETKYWLRLIIDAGLLNGEKTKPILQENEELIKILTAIVKKAQNRLSSEL